MSNLGRLLVLKKLGERFKKQKNADHLEVHEETTKKSTSKNEEISKKKGPLK